MSDKPRNIPDISITPERDGVAPYRRSGRGEPPRQSHFNGLLVFVIALMAVIMGIGGYALYEAKQLMAAGQRNIEDLDARLAATGTDVSKTLQTMQEQLKTNGDEIRKLWDVSNKRNKGWIKANEKEITIVDEKVIGLATSFAKFEADLLNIKQASDEAIAEVGDMRTQFLITEGRVQDQIDQFTATKRQIAILEKQLKEANEAIEAIDRHRAQVNQEIRFLRDHLQVSED